MIFHYCYTNHIECMFMDDSLSIKGRLAVDFLCVLRVWPPLSVPYLFIQLPFLVILTSKTNGCNQFKFRPLQIKACGRQKISKQLKMSSMSSLTDMFYSYIWEKQVLNVIKLYRAPFQLQVHMGHLIELVRSGWLDIGQVFFLRVYGPRRSRGIKHQNMNLAR